MLILCCDSASLGSVNKSPSALFVASDGVSLRLYQAVLDARSLLTTSSTKQTQVSLHLVNICIYQFLLPHNVA